VRRAAAAGDDADADLGLAEERLLAAGVPQVTGQGQFVAGAAGAAPDGRDAGVRRLAQP
jgi:hypothetical protein